MLRTLIYYIVEQPVDTIQISYGIGIGIIWSNWNFYRLNKKIKRNRTFS